jgi:hypothetical protein
MAVTTESLTQQLPPYLSDAFRQAVERSVKLSHDQYRPYTGQRVPHYPAELREANRLTHQNVGNVNPYLQHASRLTQRGTQHFPSNYQYYRDPYQRRMANNIAMQGNRIFKEKILPELDARYIQLGQYGSSKHARMARNAARDIQRDIMGRQEEALSHGYSQQMQQFGLDRSRELQTAKMMAELATLQKAAQLQDRQTLEHVGRSTQQDEEALLNQAYQDWRERENHPHDKLAQLISFLSGVPRAPATLQRQYVPMPSERVRPRWGDFLEGAGMNLLGSLLMGQR